MARQKPYRPNNKAEEAEIHRAGKTGMHYTGKLIPRLEKVWVEGFKKYLDGYKTVDVRWLNTLISSDHLRTHTQLEIVKHVINREITTGLCGTSETGNLLYLPSLPLFELTSTPFGPNWEHVIRQIYITMNDKDEADHLEFINHHPDSHTKLTWFRYAGEHNFKLEKL